MRAGKGWSVWTAFCALATIVFGVATHNNIADPRLAWHLTLGVGIIAISITAPWHYPLSPREALAVGYAGAVAGLYRMWTALQAAKPDLPDGPLFVILTVAGLVFFGVWLVIERTRQNSSGRN